MFSRIVINENLWKPSSASIFSTLKPFSVSTLLLQNWEDNNVSEHHFGSFFFKKTNPIKYDSAQKTYLNTFSFIIFRNQNS